MKKEKRPTKNDKKISSPKKDINYVSQKIKRVIPFGMTSNGLLLRGNNRKIAEIEYYYKGEDKDRRILEVEYPKDSSLFELKSLELDERYGHDINNYDYELRKLNNSYEFKEKSFIYDLEKNQLNFKYHKITKNEYDKNEATLTNKPWIAVSTELKEEEGSDGMYFTFDWNDQFIKFLKNNGYNDGMYVGMTDEELIEVYTKEMFMSNLDPADAKEYFDIDIESKEGDYLPVDTSNFKRAKSSNLANNRKGYT